jgi:hypothetical protein
MHPTRDQTTAWCLTKMEAVPRTHFTVAISYIISWIIRDLDRGILCRLHKYLPVKGLQCCFLFENFGTIRKLRRFLSFRPETVSCKVILDDARHTYHKAYFKVLCIGYNVAFDMWGQKISVLGLFGPIKTESRNSFPEKNIRGIKDMAKLWYQKAHTSHNTKANLKTRNL